MRGRTREGAAGPVGAYGMQAESAAVVGTWMWRCDDRHILDSGAAVFLTGAPDLADTELRAEVLARRVLLADRPALLSAMERMNRECGLVVLEYRVWTPEGVRWLLNHGRVYPALQGVPAHGHGVLIDITHRKMPPPEPDGSEASTPSALERAARHALGARDAVDEDGSASLRLLVDMFLLEVGRVIARRAGVASAHGLN
ncbi:hypothetical protein [Methylobacterium gregans]|uniref:PAS domain-containing protein n=1 Tax=Methylobacterium gregans TaxID=374424 RepID=A0AA37MBD5_9HYPH|nr:hypothetical protein [Methylobacterium gregans]MDQ0523119.1 hypothetical protein [Methylobacterium gregans]GJD79755.1 hypothetical protein NBEOAGPD_2984 [Methylobacterium gregans]GLS56975.1 hypothetical protein GCM10007886_51610 [Methylobacterium gregans]